MVGLKKLFLTDKTPRPATSLGLEGYDIDQPYFHTAVDSPARSHFEGGFSSRDSRSLDVAHHFDQIEKQFEDLHDQLERPTSSQSQLRPLSSTFAPPKPQNGRHIDLMAALFSTEHNQATTPESLSPPASAYNEDVAERNMTRFLRIQYRNGLARSGILSALYQEDVADRNIAKYNRPDRSLSHISSRSSPAAPGRVRIPESQRRKARKRDPGKPSWASAENLRTKLSPGDGSGTSSPRSQSHLGNYLRPRRSAPSLSADEGFVPQEDAPPTPVQRLGVPPAYKQGKRWSNTPLPDSPTIPTPMGDSAGAAEAPSVPRPPATIAHTTQRSLPPPQLSELSSKKNARGLSINTQLAAQGRPKIAHRAIQPPTPSICELKQAPSIAEVMNSPLPVPSPISPPKSSSRFKASDMMDLFSKAYASARGSHPTYETLQDAIVREVNSHEAFRRVPVPAPGPPFTPSSDQTEFSNDSRPSTGLHRSLSAKNRLMSKNSYKHKRNPETRRSISTSVGYDRLLRKVSSPTRRRHTDAPAPTPGFLAEFQPHKDPIITRPGSGEPITYLDVLRASSEQRPISTGCAGPSVSRKRGQSESISNLAAMPCSAPDVPFAPATVYCMQAHSAPSSNTSHEDSDDDIIHLPNPTPPPRVQIEGVDENNVRYVIDAASPDEAQKLMYWPQQIRRGGSSNHYGNSLSPLSRARMQLRSRSVEAY
ncbi:hypothetical protein N7489_000531 [Penicillium chrysogenum]|jgi:hypothetical protein|uniref:Uncharacterized protein n=1 Tax=Penicillium chrysogenum TaxID=5076 RepID=A0ABQ8WGZ2_PENCH|nr:uncharacterized protein N7489_000531 [Penicillium chrysogenum]KAJ5250121.1 hypothetical protein N7489_000531 [Penicillium chrysogenum]KAJ5269026.1 hypothetical protein N7505_004784 [Penicillium chrysogenum]